MIDIHQIYDHYADQYEQLVQCEDCQGNILRTLQRITPLNGQRVVEFGAGTGRLTCLLAPQVKEIRAFDSSQHMLDVAIAKLRRFERQNWRVQVSDHRKVPVKTDSADIAISGWSFCYLVVWNEPRWESELGKGLAEMRRVVRPGGVLILLETLGTGHTSPQPPDHLQDYYHYLEDHGFEHTSIRTDYCFKDIPEAERLVRFFFGDEMVDKVQVEDGQVTLPECTGIWWLR